MNNIKLKMVTALMLTSLAGAAASAYAGSKHFADQDVQRNVIKVEAEAGEGIIVVAGNNGERKKYELTFAELDNMDNVAATLDDLEQDTKDKVLALLNKVKLNETKVIEFKDAEFVVDGAETEVFMVKTGNGEDQMHIEIDVEGAGANGEKRVFVQKLLGEGKRHHKIFHKRMKGDKRNPTELIKKIIDKAELSEQQITEIKAALDAK